MSTVMRCDRCGARIRMVMVIPTVLNRRKPRSYIPLERDYDAAKSPIPPSHAMNLARTVCHPITPDWPLEAHEVPALTHFAVCAAGRRSTAT